MESLAAILAMILEDPLPYSFDPEIHLAQWLKRNGRMLTEAKPILPAALEALEATLQPLAQAEIRRHLHKLSLGYAVTKSEACISSFASFMG